jgi:hypothetical protein
MYKRVNPFFGEPSETHIKRISDNSFIPMEPMNSDYQEYLKWLEEGNEPLPADE